MPPHPMDNVACNAALDSVQAQQYGLAGSAQQIQQEMQAQQSWIAGMQQVGGQRNDQQFQNIYNAGVAAMQQAGWPTTGPNGLGALMGSAGQGVQSAPIFQQRTQQQNEAFREERLRRERELKKDCAWVEFMLLIKNYCDRRDAADRVSWEYTDHLHWELEREF